MDGTDGQVIGIEVSGRVATVTLSRPEARNALDAALRRALRSAMADLDGDDGVDVVVLTGADPAFCAGLDLRELGRVGLPRDADAASGRPGEPWARLAKPVIGAINGVAVTGGLEVALRCDFLVASERARFADTHARVGVQPGWGLTVDLPAAIGVRRAREMSLTGNFIDAPTAVAWGLVDRVVPHTELLPRCHALAADIVSNDQAGVRRILETYAVGRDLDGAGARRLEAEVAAGWRSAGGGAADEVERRREAIVERGRGQTSTRR